MPLSRALAVVFLGLTLMGAAQQAGYRFAVPAWMPQPPATAREGMTAARIALGRQLFYDERLSSNDTMSCGTCHEQARAFTDGKRVHAGVHGDDGIRNVPSIANLAWVPTLNWGNPGLTRLEAQVLIPIFGDDPVEMGLQGAEQRLFDRLTQDPRMLALLRAAYPDKARFDLEALTGALSAFIRTITSFDSPYDRYKRGGDAGAISAAAKRGENLFFSEALECAHCHGGQAFSDNFQSEATPFPEIGFHNTGLFNEDGKGAYPARNRGARDVTGRAEDEGRFRSPSLRNVALTAPYMHDGSIATLTEVIRDHYAVGGRAAKGPHGQSPLRDPLITGFAISDAEIADLEAFLVTLTDSSLLTNPAYSDPDKPATVAALAARAAGTGSAVMPTAKSPVPSSSPWRTQ